jgi:hypothetical protein
MWGSNLNFSNWKGKMGKQEPGGQGAAAGSGTEPEEQQGYNGGREESKSQLGGFFPKKKKSQETGLWDSVSNRGHIPHIPSSLE